MLEGIISIRQYRRYLYGEVEIPFGVVAQLATRMNIPPNKLLVEFEEEKNIERRMIIDFYNAVVTRNFELTDKYFSKIDRDQIIENEHKMLYDSAFANYEFYMGKITNETRVAKQKEIVDYPKIMSNKILTDSEMIILATILDSDKFDNIDIVERFELIFMEDDFHISGDNAAIMIQIVFWLAKYYGYKKEYDRTIEYCDYGIKNNKALRTIYLMEYFNYYKALSYYRLGEFELYEKALYEAVLYLEILPDIGRVNRFYNIIKKDLNVEPLQFIRDFIDGKLKESKE
jgi:tetratricopeptide (TPR) repeat protein